MYQNIVFKLNLSVKRSRQEMKTAKDILHLLVPCLSTKQEYKQKYERRNKKNRNYYSARLLN